MVRGSGGMGKINGWPGKVGGRGSNKALLALLEFGLQGRSRSLTGGKLRIPGHLFQLLTKTPLPE